MRGRKVVSLYYDDWRTIEGVQRAFRVRVFDRDKESLMQTIRYESIR